MQGSQFCELSLFAFESCLDYVDTTNLPCVEECVNRFRPLFAHKDQFVGQCNLTLRNQNLIVTTGRLPNDS